MFPRSLQLKALVEEEPEKLSMLPGEEEALQESTVLAPDTSLPEVRARKPPSQGPSQGPSASSTPMPKRQQTVQARDGVSRSRYDNIYTIILLKFCISVRPSNFL